ncbi:MAG: PhnD/SsuA/transferrin family substrate-binding protein [Desulfobulbaceae bacterium]|jgi:phosphonate transport system substrate-binding protein|nr:PhnD/SsuA/transferrin family substrate-binding protein [Desulfobulbaceae bacterium]
MIIMLRKSQGPILLLVLLLTFALGEATPLQGADEAAVEQEYSFGVLPFWPLSSQEGMFSPIAAELTTTLKHRVLYQTAPSFAIFMANLEEQQYDIAYIQPFDYVTTGAGAGYLPLATRPERLHATFMVKSESPLHNVRDLVGRKIGTARKRAATTYLDKAALVEAGVRIGRDLTLKYFTSPRACLQALIIGDIDCCAVGPKNKRLFEDQTGQPLRTIHTSAEIPGALFVVHQRVPSAEREIIRRTLLETRLSGVDPGLRAQFFKTNTVGKEVYFLPVTDRDYDIVRHYLEISGDK